MSTAELQPPLPPPPQLTRGVTSPASIVSRAPIPPLLARDSANVLQPTATTANSTNNSTAAATNTTSNTAATANTTNNNTAAATNTTNNTAAAANTTNNLDNTAVATPPEDKAEPDSPEPASSPNPDDVDDKASLNGNFGWMTLDSANIPCLFRNNDKYVSVRMVEQKLLSKYPSTYPEELSKRAPLVSQFITKAESRLLNEINIEHCACDFGQLAFTTKDLVVVWNDFVAFYKIVKKHFPHELPAKKPKAQVTATGGGWVQINNTVVPYVRRLSPSGKETLRLAPLPVIKYAANLLTNTSVPTVQPLESECKTLTDMCKKAGLDFTFASDNTPMVLLTMLPVYSDVPVSLQRLPDSDPFSSAAYCVQAEESKNDARTPDAMQLTTQQNSSKVHQLADMDRIPPPNVTIGKSGTITSGTAVPKPHGAKSTSRPPPAGRSVPPAKRARTRAPVNCPTSMSMPASLAPGTVVPPAAAGLPGNALVPVPINFIMPPPGMVHGAQGVWRPQADNPADMKKLADMMNMQAAILCQSGTMASRNLLMQPSPLSAVNTSTAQAPQPTIDVPKPAAKPSTAGKAVMKGDPTIKIKPITFHNKKVSCLVKEGSKQQFALVEAISRVYFPHCNLDEFLHMLTKVLNISVYQLNHDEENAFIRFYGLPTKTLKCNKVLNLRDLDYHMTQLCHMFSKKTTAEQSAAVPAQVKPQPIIIKPESTMVPVLGEARGHSPGAQPLGIQSSRSSVVSPSSSTHSEFNNNSINSDKSESPAIHVPLPPQSMPLPSAKSRVGGLSKLSKLEDAVNRLHKNKLKSLDPEPAKDTVQACASPDNSSNLSPSDYLKPTVVHAPTFPLVAIGTTMTTEL